MTLQGWSEGTQPPSDTSAPHRLPPPEHRTLGRPRDGASRLESREKCTEGIWRAQAKVTDTGHIRGQCRPPSASSTTGDNSSTLEEKKVVVPMEELAWASKKVHRGAWDLWICFTLDLYVFKSWGGRDAQSVSATVFMGVVIWLSNEIILHRVLLKIISFYDFSSVRTPCWLTRIVIHTSGCLWCFEQGMVPSPGRGCAPRSS